MRLVKYAADVWFRIKMKQPLFRIINVAKRIDTDGPVVYRCLQDLATELYYIHSKDHIGYPATDERLEFLDKHFWDLLVEAGDIISRLEGYSNLELAIDMFEYSFGNDDLDD